MNDLMVSEQCSLLTEGRYQCDLLRRHDGPCHSDEERRRRETKMPSSIMNEPNVGDDKQREAFAESETPSPKEQKCQSCGELRIVERYEVTGLEPGEPFTIHPKVTGEWTRICFINLVKGDIFRLKEPDGRPDYVRDDGTHDVCVALSDAKPFTNEDGVKTSMVDSLHVNNLSLPTIKKGRSVGKSEVIEPMDHEEKRHRGLIKGLQMFAELGQFGTCARHDEILAGKEPVDAQQEQVLKDWGWHWSDEDDCWGFFT